MLRRHRFTWTQLHLALIFPKYYGVAANDIRSSLDQIEQQASSTSLDEDLDRQNKSSKGQLIRLYPIYRELYETNTCARSARVHAQRSLQLALTCRGRFSISLLTGMACIDPEDDEHPVLEITEVYIGRITSNFLVMDRNKMLEFAHISVKEFLQYSYPETFSDTIANIQVAASSLASLKCFSHKLRTIMSDENSERRLDPLETFVEYSVSSWPLHCRRVKEVGRQESPLKRRWDKFMLKPDVGDAYSKWTSWGLSKRINHDIQVIIQGSKSTPSDPFFAACILGFPEVVEIAIKHRLKVLDSFNRNGEAGLHLAARNCHEDITALLLASGANINIRTTESKETPLHEACGSEHTSVIGLITRGEKPRSKFSR